MLQSRFEELKRLYPSSAILDRASGIVGSKTLMINYVNDDFTVGTKRYEQGDHVPLFAISEGSRLQLDVGVPKCLKVVVVNHSVFSDFQ